MIPPEGTAVPPNKSGTVKGVFWIESSKLSKLVSKIVCHLMSMNRGCYKVPFFSIRFFFDKVPQLILQFVKEKSSSDELQKSIQLATNVLDLSEDDRCSGCCNYPKQDYGHPRIVLVNGTSKVMRLQGSNVMNITGKWYFMSKKRPLSQRKRILKHCLRK